MVMTIGHIIVYYKSEHKNCAVIILAIVPHFVECYVIELKITDDC